MTNEEAKVSSSELQKQLDRMSELYEEKIRHLELRLTTGDKKMMSVNKENDSSNSSTLTIKTKEINMVFNLDFPVGFLKDNRILTEFLKRSGN